MQANLEIYVLANSTENLVEWIKDKIGEIVSRDDIDDIVIMRSKEGVTVVVTPRIEGGPYASIELSSNQAQLPWNSSLLMAYDCASELAKTVRVWDVSTERWVETDGQVATQVWLESDD